MNDYRLGTSSRNATLQARSQGLALPDKPGDEVPALPSDITDLSDKSLMQLYAEMVAWSEYAASQVACALIDEKAAQRICDFEEAKAINAALGRGSTATAARSESKTNGLVLQAQDYQFECESYRRLVETIAESCDKSAAMLSRELTRRTSAEKTRRTNGGWTV